MFRGRENTCNFMRQRQSYNSNIKSAKSAEATMESRSWNNPMGTDGFEFIEYAAPDPQALGALFETMGFAAIARHRLKILLRSASRASMGRRSAPSRFACRMRRLPTGARSN